MNCDLHTHTQHSDGRDTVVDNVRMAEAVGLNTVAITDHLMLNENGELITGWIGLMLKDVAAARRAFRLTVLAGVEATLLDTKGRASISQEVYRLLDIVLCGLEWYCDGISINSPADKRGLLRNVIKAYSNLAVNPLVDVVAHPFNLGKFQTVAALSDFSETSLREIAAAFREGETAFEVMNEVWWWFPQAQLNDFFRDYLRVVEVFADEGVQFTVGSDAHSYQAVGNLGWANRVIQTVGIPASQMLSVEQLKAKRIRFAESS